MKFIERTMPLPVIFNEGYLKMKSQLKPLKQVFEQFYYIINKWIIACWICFHFEMALEKEYCEMWKVYHSMNSIFHFTQCCGSLCSFDYDLMLWRNIWPQHRLPWRGYKTIALCCYGSILFSDIVVLPIWMLTSSYFKLNIINHIDGIY